MRRKPIERSTAVAAKTRARRGTAGQPQSDVAPMQQMFMDETANDAYLDECAHALFAKIKAQPIAAADISKMGKTGREMMERLRREYKQPIPAAANKRGGVFLSKVVQDHDGGSVTYYTRPRNVWDDVRAWIGKMKKCADDHNIAADKIAARNGLDDLERAIWWTGKCPRAVLERFIGCCADLSKQIQSALFASVMRAAQSELGKLQIINDFDGYISRDELDQLSLPQARDRLRRARDARRMSKQQIDEIAADAKSAKEQTRHVPQLLPTIQSGVATLIDNANRESSNDTWRVNETHRPLIIQMWKDFRAGKLDANFDDDISNRTAGAFLDWCGNMRITSNPDTIVTLNDALPGGVDQFKRILHAQAQRKQAAKNKRKRKPAGR